MSETPREPLKFGVRYGKVVSSNPGDPHDVSNIRLEVWQEGYIGESAPEDLIEKCKVLVHEGLLTGLARAAEVDSKVQRPPSNQAAASQTQTAASQSQQRQVPPTTTPQEDPAKIKALESLRWTLYRPPHRAGWCFVDSAPSWLLERIHKETFVYLGEFRYSLSGAQHQFLTRNPAQRRQEAR